MMMSRKCRWDRALRSHLSGLRIQQQLVQGKGQGGVGLVPPESFGEIGQDAEVVLDHPGGMPLAWVDRCRRRRQVGGFR